MKKSKRSLRNCICGRRPELNNEKTAGSHPSRFEVKAGVVCLLVVSAVVYIVEPWWALVPVSLLLAVALIASIVKVVRRHSVACAARDGLLIGAGLYANALEALNPANWF